MPPINGSDSILPITNFKDLVIEGQQQRNCVKSYHDEILSGNYYVYKVVSPERATLGLEKKRQKKWSIDQLVSKCNKSRNKTPVKWSNYGFQGWLRKGGEGE